MRKPPTAASCRTDAEQRLWKCHYTTRAAHRTQSTEQWERVLGWLGHWGHRPPWITREETTKPWKDSFIMIRSITFPPTLPYSVSFFNKLFSLSNCRVVSVQSGKQILWAIVYGKRSRAHKWNVTPIKGVPADYFNTYLFSDWNGGFSHFHF